MSTREIIEEIYFNMQDSEKLGEVREAFNEMERDIEESHDRVSVNLEAYVKIRQLLADS